MTLRGVASAASVKFVRTSPWLLLTRNAVLPPPRWYTLSLDGVNVPPYGTVVPSVPSLIPGWFDRLTVKLEETPVNKRYPTESVVSRVKKSGGNALTLMASAALLYRLMAPVVPPMPPCASYVHRFLPRAP